MQTNLLQKMHQLSLKYFGCAWAKDIEYILYQQLSGLRFRGLISVTKEEESDLRDLFQRYKGWYYWPDESPFPMFIDWAKWDRTFTDWHIRNILFRF